MHWQVLEFEKKPEMAFEEWTSRQDKFQSFFGPGVKASLEATEQVQAALHPSHCFSKQESALSCAACQNNVLQICLAGTCLPVHSSRFVVAAAGRGCVSG